jgi:hypothetical protein
VRIWLSTKACASVVVLADVAVQGVHETSGGSFSTAGGQDVVVSVAPALAERVVAALAQDGAMIRAGVITGEPQPGANESLPDVRCAVAPRGGP